MAKESPDKDAVAAFRNYWSAFDAYEKSSLKQGKKKYQMEWEQAKTEYQKERKQAAVQELSALYKAVDKYKGHLKSHPGAANRAFVLLNLAQVLNLIGDHLIDEDQNASTFSKAESLTILNEIINNFPNFSEIEKAYYLRALVLSGLERSDEAYQAWKTLADKGGRTIYSVHANIAVGDYWFDRERADYALRAYSNGKNVLDNLDLSDKNYESARLNYRIAWSAYRAGELTQVIESATELLQPGQINSSMVRKTKIQLDATELLGDVLYENNSMSDTKRVLSQKSISSFAAMTGLRTLTRYNSQNIHNEAVKVGEYLSNAFPLAAEMPKILVLTADSYDKLDDQPRRIKHLSELAVFLPERSLWRAQQKTQYEAIKQMETLAVPATAIAADWHYERGRTTGNTRSSLAGASLYEVLINAEPNSDESNKWRLRRADCNFDADRLAEAALMYRALKSRFKVSPEILQSASYDLVRVEEKRWLNEYTRAIETSQQAHEDKKVLEALTALETSIDEYAARFPNQKRSIDLLLRGASANRDMTHYEAASRYWQRVLVSQPDPAQRGIAVRGLVLANMKLGSTGDVVEVTRRFLKLEDWKALGLNLGDELKGVLAVAALDEGKRLNDSGNVKDAGLLLTEIAKEFPDLPNRDRIYRDGAYMLAIAGNWAAAQKASESYMQTKLNENRGDMSYLLARSLHYQLRLGEAAKAYLALGKNYPRHSRAQVSLERSVELGTAEDLHGVAAEASALLAEMAPDTKTRMDHYANAITHLDKSGDPRQALSLARKRLQSARSVAEKFDAQIMVAIATYNRGPSFEQEALDDLAVLSRNIDRKKAQMKQEDYNQLSARIHFQLGQENLRRFKDFRIAKRNGPEDANVTTKLKYFEELADEFNRSALNNLVDWAPQSRYSIARSAEDLADEIASLDAKRQTAPRYRTTIERLRSLAKKYHSTNVLTAKQDPLKYKNNEWVQKSSASLATFEHSKSTSGYSEIVPDASSPDLPSQWSL
jgi:hypothetical protein